MSRCSGRLALVCVALALGGGRLSEAFCDGGHDDPVACLKAKAIAALDRFSRHDELPLPGQLSAVTLVRLRDRHQLGNDDDDDGQRRDPRLVRPTTAVDERELRSRPDDELNAMLYEKTVGLLSDRTVRIGLPEMTADQLRTTLEEGRGKMKKTMGMMMTAVAMKAMMIIPLALGLLFLIAGKAMIISKIALVLSLIITLKKLMSKSGGEQHVVHEAHSSSATAWPSSGSQIGYGGGGGGWAKRSSAPVAGHVQLAYKSYKP